MTKLNSGTREKLKNVSTATICTALFKRGLRNQFIQDVRPLKTRRDNMVGEAFTLRYIPAREDLNPISVFEDRLHPQRKAVEDCPPGASNFIPRVTVVILVNVPSTDGVSRPVRIDPADLRASAGTRADPADTPVPRR